MFNPSRLSLARQRRKLTKKELAELLSVDQKTVLRYESGESIPSPESLSALSKILDFPEIFFFGADIDEPPSESASFRSLKALLARDRDAALAASRLAFFLSDWIDERFTLPKVDLIELKEDTDPEAAARILRQKWALGERSINNMVHLLEAKGIRVFSLVENSRTVDAFCMWRRDIPYVFLNTTKTAERSRFDAAHELGHLILHRHGVPQGRALEDQANQFASAFLMPEAEVKAKIPRIYSLNQIIEAKKLWRVSVAALNYRLHKLGITSDWQYRTFCIQIIERFGQSEPYGIPRELSQIWEKILVALKQEKITKHNIAASLGVAVFEIENLIFQLTNMQSIDGKSISSTKSQANLRLVKG